MPEPNLRLELYRRFARLASPAAADAFADELADRFGELPAPVQQLLDEARLRAWCMAHRVTRLDAGPNAVALTVSDPALLERLPGTGQGQADHPADRRNRRRRAFGPAMRGPDRPLTRASRTLPSRNR